MNGPQRETSGRIMTEGLAAPRTNGRPIDDEDLQAGAPRSPVDGSTICSTENIMSGGLDIPGGGRRAQQQKLGVPSPSGSPLSYKSQVSFADEATRSIPIRTKSQNLAPDTPQYGTSPRTIPMPLPPRPSSTQEDEYSRSPKPAGRLAPDQFGKDIPHDARWTRIRRSLVSPVVLEQEGLRYEA